MEFGKRFSIVLYKDSKRSVANANIILLEIWFMWSEARLLLLLLERGKNECFVEA